MKGFYLKPKLFAVRKELTRKQLVSDVVAGIIVAIIALPLSIALAIASGVEPACGIYTAIAAGILVSLLGGSRVQIAGPTAAFATIVAGIVATQGMDGLFIATVTAGIILVLMGVCKLGGLIKFIPSTITTGFTAGIAVTLFIGQIKDFLGLSYASGVKPIEAIEKIEANIDAISTFSWQALLVGVVCLAILIIYPKFEKRVPPSLIAVIVGALMVKFIPGLDEGVFTIGDLYNIPKGLPSVDFGGMNISLSRVIDLLPSAATIALLAGIESLLSCVVADNMIDSKHNPNAELVAQGVANVGSVLFGGIPATGAIARTAANVKNGGRTPVAGIVHGIVLLLVLLVLMPVASLIPMPCIAAILFVVAYNMSEWRKMKHIVTTAPLTDIAVALLTFLLTVIFDLVVAIAVGMGLALLFAVRYLFKRLAITEAGGNADSQSFELRGALIFTNCDNLAKLSLKEGVSEVVLHMGGVPHVDATAVGAIAAFSKRCKKAGATLRLEALRPQPQKAISKANAL